MKTKSARPQQAASSVLLSAVADAADAAPASLQEAFAQLIAAITTIGNHPDCDEDFGVHLRDFSFELQNHLYTVAQNNSHFPGFDQQSEMLTLLLRHAFTRVDSNGKEVTNA